MTTVNSYLTFDGNCKTAFDFYKAAFNREFDFVGTFGEMPPQEGQPEITEEEKSKIMHISLPISNDNFLFGSDAVGEWSNSLKMGNNITLSINTETIKEADRLMSVLSEGGMITMPMENTFWGAYFGMLTDQFGINWMINVDIIQENA